MSEKRKFDGPTGEKEVAIMVENDGDEGNGRGSAGGHMRDTARPRPLSLATPLMAAVTSTTTAITIDPAELVSAEHTVAGQ